MLNLSGLKKIFSGNNKVEVKLPALGLLLIVATLLFYTSREILHFKKQIKSDIAYIIAYQEVSIIKKKSFSSIKEGLCEPIKIESKDTVYYQRVSIKSINPEKKRVDVKVSWQENTEAQEIKITQYVTKKSQLLSKQPGKKSPISMGKSIFKKVLKKLKN
ncbi:MAG: hypothetical protein A2252_04300 [Elusimicrobia bacterium RIFOXYA2_FULL_39_19]|nr:MAG: hypothetical protein A2252_04300 [Elusimicrobia bacterium RIFOXYA2_FULL_39_19]